MTEVADQSNDENEKIAAYRRAAKDQQAGVANPAEPAPPDGGMSESGEMPSHPMSDDRHPNARPAEAGRGAMPRPGMDRGAKPQTAPGSEMPRPSMN